MSSMSLQKVISFGFENSTFSFGTTIMDPSFGTGGATGRPPLSMKVLKSLFSTTIPHIRSLFEILDIF
jgi:hypothetical protein